MLCFDGGDGFTIRNGEDREPFQLPGLGRLVLRTIPDGAWPILLEKRGRTTRVYFHFFLSRLVMYWQFDEGSAEPSLQTATPEFDEFLHQAKDMTWTNPAWDWLRFKRSSGRDAPTLRVGPVSQDIFAGLEQDIILARYRATDAAEFSIQITQILCQMTLKSGLNALLLAKLITPDSLTVGIDDPFFALAPQHLREIRHILGAWAILTRGFSLALDIGEMDCSAPPVITSIVPFAKTNTIQISFAMDKGRRPQMHLQIALAMFRAALLGDGHGYGRSFEALKHLSKVLRELNVNFRDGRQLSFSFDDKSVDPGLRFNRSRDSKEPLIPDPYLLAELAKWKKADRSLDIYRGPPFLERKKQLFWRGSTSGSTMYSLAEFFDNYRVKACLLTRRELPEHADCKISRLVQLPEKFREEARSFLIKSDILSAVVDTREFAQYQMFLDLPGNASAWGTCIRYFQGILIFRVAHEHELLYYEWLEPWKHYIPVAADLSDLKSGVEWALLHQEEAAQIAANGRAVMLEFLANAGDILSGVLRDTLQRAQPASQA